MIKATEQELRRAIALIEAQLNRSNSLLAEDALNERDIKVKQRRYRECMEKDIDKCIESVLHLIHDRATFEKVILLFYDMLGQKLTSFCKGLPVGETLYRDCHLAISGRVAFWRSHFIELLLEKEKLNQTTVPQPRASTDKLPTKFSNRANWLKAQMHDNDLSKNSFLTKHGPDPKTVQRILDCLPVGPKPLSKLAKSLGVKREEIPNN